MPRARWKLGAGIYPMLDPWHSCLLCTTEPQVKDVEYLELVSLNFLNISFRFCQLDRICAKDSNLNWECSLKALHTNTNYPACSLLTPVPLSKWIASMECREMIPWLFTMMESFLNLPSTPWQEFSHLVVMITHSSEAPTECHWGQALCSIRRVEEQLRPLSWDYGEDKSQGSGRVD